MKFDQLQQSWQEEQLNGASNMNSDIMINQYQDMNKQARERTLYGTIAFSLIIVFLGFFNYFLSLTGAPVLVVGAIYSWIIVFVINAVRLWQVRSQQPNSSQVVTEHLEQKLVKVIQEKHFYLSLWYWISLPAGIGLLVMFYGLRETVQGIHFLYLVAYFALAVFGHGHCKKYVKSKLNPLIAILECSEEQTQKK